MESGIWAVEKALKQRGDVSRETPQYQQCASLVAKAVIADDHVYSASEIMLARELLAYEWNDNVRSFLLVIAGIVVPRDEPIGEAYGALVFQSNR
jgi:hypothetical protein